MKLKKAMACMLAGAMVLSMGAVLPAAASEDDNTLNRMDLGPELQRLRDQESS